MKKNRIPPGLQLSFNLQLDKDNHYLQESCEQHLQVASFAILKSLSHATWQKTKTLQNQLQLEREILLSNYEESHAKRIWRRTARQINFKLLQYDLIRTERRKFKKTTPYIPPSYGSHPPTDNTTRSRSRPFSRWRREAQDRESTNAKNEGPGQNAPNLTPINLSSTDLTNAESTLLTKGPAFCPMPKDVHWQKVIDDLDNFDKRIRLAVFHHDKSELKIRRRLTSATASGSELTARIISGCRRCEVSRRSGHVCNVTEVIFPSRLKRE